MRRVAAVGYYVCWTLATAISATLIAAVLWEAYVARSGTLLGRIDDDVTYAVMGPLGAVVGVLAARRTRESRILHRVCRTLGLVCVLAGITMAIVFKDKGPPPGRAVKRESRRREYPASSN